MKVFCHHIYEYRKGLRKLILYTGDLSSIKFMEEKLKNRNIGYLIDKISENKVNVFFGSQDCIDVLNRFSTLELDKITDTEDFILGAMLGYDLAIQCRRFVKRKRDKNYLNGKKAG